MIYLFSCGRYWLPRKDVKKLLPPYVNPLSANPQKIVKNIQIIHRLLPTNCLGVFDHFVGLALKGLGLNFIWLAVVVKTDIQTLKTR